MCRRVQAAFLRELERPARLLNRPLSDQVLQVNFMCKSGQHISNTLLIIHLVLLFVPILLSFPVRYYQCKNWSHDNHDQTYSTNCLTLIAAMLLMIASNTSILAPLYAKRDVIQGCLSDGWTGVIRVVAQSLTVVTGLLLLGVLASIIILPVVRRLMRLNASLYQYFFNRNEGDDCFYPVYLVRHTSTRVQQTVAKIQMLNDSSTVRLSSLVSSAGGLLGSNLTAVLTLYVILNQLAFADSSVADNLMTGAIALLIASVWLSLSASVMIGQVLLDMLLAARAADSLRR